MITTNVAQRTFLIRSGRSSGTAFALDYKNRQYLITARHLFECLTSDQTIGIYHDKEWKQMTVKVVGVGSNNADVAVLSCPFLLAPSHPLPASFQLIIGQAVYFLGFPFGWDAGGEEINRRFPLPFVKGGLVSAIHFGKEKRLYIDGHNNVGFSGGPVVFVPSGQNPSNLCVAGVVSRYAAPWRPVMPSRDNSGEPIGFLQENSGIVVASGIRHVTDVIDSNPVGVPFK